MKRTKTNSSELLKRIMAAPQMELADLSKFFKEEEMPTVDVTPIGRHRLLQAFRNKYGETYRNKRGVSKILRDYDDQRDFFLKAMKARD
jgi:hypothetical protein